MQRLTNLLRLVGTIALAAVLAACGRSNTSIAVSTSTDAQTSSYPITQSTALDAYPLPNSGIPVVDAAPTVFTDYAAVDGVAPQLGIVVDQAMEVVHIEPGGLAEQAGMRVGDTLVTVDGVSAAKSSAEAKQRIRTMASGQQLPIIVERGGYQINLELKTLVAVLPATTSSAGPVATVTPVIAPFDYW